MRASLRHDISDVVDEFGPKLFEDFEHARLRRPSVARDAVRPVLDSDGGNSYGQGEATFFANPLGALLTRSDVCLSLMLLGLKGYIDSLLFGRRGSYMPLETDTSEAEPQSDGASGSSTPRDHAGARASLDVADFDEVRAFMLFRCRRSRADRLPPGGQAVAGGQVVVQCQ